GQLHAHDFFIAPPGAKLDRKWNRHRSSNRLEDFSDGRQVAKQARTAVTLHDLLRRAAKVQVDQIKAESFDHAGGFGHDLRIAAEELRRDGMLVFVKVQIAL